MTSQIDATLPVTGSPSTQSVRDNFAIAKAEITALQAGGGGGGGSGTITGVTAGTGLTGGGTTGTVSLAVSFGTTGGTAAAGNDSRITGAVSKAGDTLTGPLVLAADPTLALGAATKQYVDNPLPVAVGGPVTLSFANHQRRKLYVTATTTVTVPSAGTLTDGFWTCIYTDVGHTVTISGTAYDLAGNAVTSIPPSSKAEVGVWGGLVYALVTSNIIPNTVAQSTLSNTGWLIPLFNATDNSEGITDIKHLLDFAASSVSAMRSWDGGAVVANGTTYFTADAPYAGTITSLKSKSSTGTFTVAIQINGTPVTGLGAVAVSGSSFASTTATAANAFNASDVITGVISSAASSPTDAVLNLKIARN